MAYDEKLAERLRKLLSRKRQLTEKKMFGGMAFFLKGNLLCGIYKNDLILRLDPKNFWGALEKPHTKPFDITGRPMRGWIMVEPTGIRTATSLQKWLQPALRYVSKLPKKSN